MSCVSSLRVRHLQKRQNDPESHPARLASRWWGQDLNLRPLGYEPDQLQPVMPSLNKSTECSAAEREDVSSHCHSPFQDFVCCVSVASSDHKEHFDFRMAFDFAGASEWIYFQRWKAQAPVSASAAPVVRLVPPVLGGIPALPWQDVCQFPRGLRLERFR